MKIFRLDSIPSFIISIPSHTFASADEKDSSIYADSKNVTWDTYECNKEPLSPL